MAPSDAVGATVFAFPSANQFSSNDWGETLRNDFQPPINRYLLVILAPTAAGTQRACSAFLDLIPRGITPERAPDLAREINTPRRTLLMPNLPGAGLSGSCKHMLPR